jgi:hypothetical protein
VELHVFTKMNWSPKSKDLALLMFFWSLMGPVMALFVVGDFWLSIWLLVALGVLILVRQALKPLPPPNKWTSVVGLLLLLLVLAPTSLPGLPEWMHTAGLVGIFGFFLWHDLTTVLRRHAAGTD